MSWKNWWEKRSLVSKIVFFIGIIIGILSANWIMGAVCGLSHCTYSEAFFTLWPLTLIFGIVPIVLGIVFGNLYDK